MPLLLRLFFIRGSKNNRRRSHAGSEGRTAFQKKQASQVVWSLGMSRRGTAPAKLARLFSKKIPDRFARHGRMHEDARRQDFLAASQKRCGTAAFPQRAVHWTWKTSGKRGLPGGRKRMRQRQCLVIQKNSTPCCRPARGRRIQIRSSRSSPGKSNHEK